MSGLTEPPAQLCETGTEGQGSARLTNEQTRHRASLGLNPRPLPTGLFPEVGAGRGGAEDSGPLRGGAPWSMGGPRKRTVVPVLSRQKSDVVRLRPLPGMVLPVPPGSLLPPSGLCSDAASKRGDTPHLDTPHLDTPHLVTS